MPTESCPFPSARARGVRTLGLALTAVLLGFLTACSSPPAPVAPESGGAKIRVISNRADLVSGGNAMVEIEGVDDEFTADVDGRDVTEAFAVRANGRTLGLIDGLGLGRNVLRVRAQGRATSITITNHPIGGPIFTGTQIEPWLCATEAHGLGTAEDAQCNARTVYTYFYWPQNDSGFKAYDPTLPPRDVATTTTDQGKSVPYIVRQEVGTHNRGIYRIAVLFDPARGWQPWSPQEGWNGKLLYPFGASCGTLHAQGGPVSVLIDRALARGFMVATSSLNVLGTNCNTWTSAEAVMMLKEHIIEAYGEIRYTMGEGGSGGAIGQHMVANSYPGLLQGIQPTSGYEDVWSTAMEVADCRLLMNYFGQSSMALTAEQQAAVTGQATTGPCAAWRPLFRQVLNPQGNCGLDRQAQYHPVDNPRGCRSTVQDFTVAIMGRRSSELWSDSPSRETRDAEAMAGGFARLPYDNAGVQYGLQALLDGRISTAQFVDLNAKIGTIDVDANLIAGRRRADAGSELLYRTGGINDGGQLDQVAIIDLRATSNYEIHTDYHSYAMRARLDQANGHHDNQLIWTHTVSVAQHAFLELDRWLAAVEADTSDDPVEVKLVRNKPATAVDSCFIDGERVTDGATCAEHYPYYGSPRLAAGMRAAHDINSCQLKPLDTADYPEVAFSDAEWAQLRAVFPNGICDYRQPGIGQTPSIPWLTYADGSGGSPVPDPSPG